jgi:hypothetical protein
MATVDLTVAADLSALRRQLAEIPGLSADAATKMSAELNKSIKSAEKASLTAAKASKAAAEGAKASGRAAADALDTAAASATRFGDKAGAVGSNAGKLAGILDMLVPGLGGVARGVADVADTAEVASVATKGLGVSMSSTLAVLGPVAIAVAALGATYVYLSSVLDEVEVKNKAATDDAIAQAEATKKVRDRKQEVSDLFETSGDAAKAEGIAIRKANEATDASFRDALARAKDSVQQKKDAKAQAGQALNSPELQAAQKILVSLEEEIELTKTKGELVITQQFAAQKAAKETVEVELAAAKAAGARAAAEAALVAEEAARAEVERGILEQTQNYRSVLTSLQETTRATNDAQLEGAAAIEASLARQIEKVNELAAAKVESGVGGTEEILAIEATRLEAVTALQAKAAEDIDAIYAASSEKRTKQRGEELAAEAAFHAQRTQATASATSDLLGTTSDAFAAAAEEQSKTNKDAAMAMFAASKAAAVAQAVVNTALAISSANTLPPPANFIAMAAAGVSGAVSLAAIASSPPPSFNDTPGVQMMGQRGNVSLASGDYFAAARSPTELQRQVGATAGGGVSILQVRLGHKVLDQSVARTIQEGGRLSREISTRTKTGTTGHRSRA